MISLVVIVNNFFTVTSQATPKKWSDQRRQAGCTARDLLGHNRDLLKDAPRVLIMLLSPRMPYALQEWKRMQVLAQQSGYIALTLRDSRVSNEEWQAALTATQLDVLQNAPVLDETLGRACNLLNHAPSSLVLHKGLVHPWPILGVMPDATWIALLRSRTECLQHLSSFPYTTDITHKLNCGSPQSH